MSSQMDQQVVLARLAAAIERAAADLGLEEEPARFAVALEDCADPEAGADHREHGADRGDGA